MPEKAFLAQIEEAGFEPPRVLERTRNARTRDTKAHVCAAVAVRG